MVLVTFLDCSKAFDTISHHGIFVKLMDRGVPLCFLKIISYWYLNMKSRCRWGDAYSDSFDVLSGVKQGGVLSPRISFFLLPFVTHLSCMYHVC